MEREREELTGTRGGGEVGVVGGREEAGGGVGGVEAGVGDGGGVRVAVAGGPAASGSGPAAWGPAVSRDEVVGPGGPEEGGRGGGEEGGGGVGGTSNFGSLSARV